MTTALHQRKTIRDAVVAALVAADTAAGARCYPTRVVPWKRLTLPAISVYGLSESSDDKQSAPRELTRTMQLAVEAAVKGANIDDALDALALEIERAMHADPSFGDVCSDCVLTGTELEAAVDGDEPVGFLRLTYRTTYFTDAPAAADVTVDDLSTVDAKTSLGGLQAVADQSEDKIEDLEVVA